MMIETDHDGYINSDYIEWIVVEPAGDEDNEYWAVSVSMVGMEVPAFYYFGESLSEAFAKQGELVEMINSERRAYVHTNRE